MLIVFVEWFKIYSRMRQGYIIFPWLFSIYGCSDRGEDGFGKKGRE